MTETTFYNSGLDIVVTLWGKVLEFIYSQLFENIRNTGRGMMVISACVLFHQVHKNSNNSLISGSG